MTAGEFVVDPPTLINLGFEWFIDGDDNRNAAVDVSYRKAGRPRVETGAAAASPAGRGDLQRRAARRRLARTCSPAAFSISSPIRRTRRSSCCRIRTASRGETREDGDGPHAAGAEAVRRRAHVPRLSARLHGPEDRAGVRRSDVRLQPDVLRHRLGDRRPAARASRATRSWSTPASTSTTASSTRTTPPSARCRSTAPTT